MCLDADNGSQLHECVVGQTGIRNPNAGLGQRTR